MGGKGANSLSDYPLILSPGSAQLGRLYERAFEHARELYVVSAYLTAWNTDLRLAKGCKFRMVVGKDFGITRKDACRKVLKWLPANRKQNFYVAAYIGGFHPKAIFWKDENNQHHMLVGSSNLTEAAFKSNYEANLYSRVDSRTYEDALEWIERIIEKSRPVDSSWLKTYQEAQLTGKKNNAAVPLPSDPSKDFFVPRISQERFQEALKGRRDQIRAFSQIRGPLKTLFRRGASRELSNEEICKSLLDIWGTDESRFQGKGWERTGIKSDWQLFARGLTAVLDANDRERDDVVVVTIDKLANAGLPTRKALLSEMLCHFFSERYPVINGPVQLWIKKMKFRAPFGSSEGAKFMDMAEKMRAVITHNSTGTRRIRNLAELDCIIWEKYKDEYMKQKRTYS